MTKSFPTQRMRASRPSRFVSISSNLFKEIFSEFRILKPEQNDLGIHSVRGMFESAVPCSHLVQDPQSPSNRNLLLNDGAESVRLWLSARSFKFDTVIWAEFQSPRSFDARIGMEYAWRLRSVRAVMEIMKLALSIECDLVIIGTYLIASVGVQRHNQTASLSVWTHFMLKAVKLKFDWLRDPLHRSSRRSWQYRPTGSICKGLVLPPFQQNPSGFLEARSGNWFRHDSFVFDFHLMESDKIYF